MNISNYTSSCRTFKLLKVSFLPQHFRAFLCHVAPFQASGCRCAAPPGFATEEVEPLVPNWQHLFHSQGVTSLLRIFISPWELGLSYWIKAITLSPSLPEGSSTLVQIDLSHHSPGRPRYVCSTFRVGISTLCHPS